jgi:hypothetical protein
MEGSGPAQTNTDLDPGGPKTYRSYEEHWMQHILAEVETKLLCLPGSQFWPQLDPSESSRFVRYIHSYIILHHDGVSSSVPE